MGSRGTPESGPHCNHAQHLYNGSTQAYHRLTESEYIPQSCLGDSKVDTDESCGLKMKRGCVLLFGTTRKEEEAWRLCLALQTG